jgi:hypothetical protein
MSQTLFKKIDNLTTTVDGNQEITSFTLPAANRGGSWYGICIGRRADNDATRVERMRGAMRLISSPMEENTNESSLTVFGTTTGMGNGAQPNGTDMQINANGVAGVTIEWTSFVVFGNWEDQINEGSGGGGQEVEQVIGDVSVAASVTGTICEFTMPNDHQAAIIFGEIAGVALATGDAKGARFWGGVVRTTTGNLAVITDNDYSTAGGVGAVIVDVSGNVVRVRWRNDDATNAYQVISRFYIVLGEAT